MKTFAQFIIEAYQLSKKDIEKAADWRDGGLNRTHMSKLAGLAVHGGPLHHLHPGNVEIHRGMMNGGAPHHKTGTSWTKSKKQAWDYTDVGHPMHTMKTNKHTPAIDINKLLKKRPSDASHGQEREVFVAKGDYKTKQHIRKK